MKPPVLCLCCGLVEESESMEFMVSEEKRQDILQTKFSKQQPSRADKNREAFGTVLRLFVYWERKVHSDKRQIMPGCQRSQADRLPGVRSPTVQGRKASRWVRDRRTFEVWIESPQIDFKLHPWFWCN